MHISNNKLRKLIYEAIQEEMLLSEGMFDNMFGFIRPQQRLLSDDLIQAHVDNLYTAYYKYLELNPNFSSEYIDSIKVFSDFEQDLKNAQLGTVSANLRGTGYSPEQAFKQLIEFKKIRNLREVINNEGVNNKLYKRYEEILLGYLSKNFRR